MPRQARKVHDLDHLADDVVRLRTYAGQIRQAIRSGHRLNFTAEQVLDAVQQAVRQCSRVSKNIQAQSEKDRAHLDGMAAAQDQIDDALMALRERMMFGRL
ncbi:MAG: hypothetical protein ABWY82_09530 [Tardiphaga sp.]